MKVFKVVYALALLFLTLFLSCEQEEFPTALPNEAGVTKMARPLSKGVLDILVTTTSDVADFGGGQQVADLPGPDGIVSLREAVVAANNTTGPQSIGFRIPKEDPGFDAVSGVFTIKLKTDRDLSLSDNGTTIDGSTQRDFTGDTNPAGPEIVLDGSENPFEVTSVSAINIGSSNNHIHGLVVINCWTGIAFGGPNATDNTVTGCFVGVDASGRNPQSQSYTFYGIGAQFGPSRLRIGGSGREERNIISGYEIGIFIEKVSFITIQNNFIGTDVTGKIAVGNKDGIRWGEAGVEPVCRNITIKDNIISGNMQSGIAAHYSQDLWVLGNIIGPDIDGNPLGNGFHGIGTSSNYVSSRVNIGGPKRGDGNVISGNSLHGIVFYGIVNDAVVEGNTITHNIYGVGGNGGTMLITKNVVAFNRSTGIDVAGAGSVFTISKNEIYSNQDIGINLRPDAEWVAGVTPNDPGDTDVGPNTLINFPVLISAVATPGKLIVRGTIDTPNPSTITIEFFSNPVPSPGGDPSGHGEGAVYLGSDRPNPQGKFTATLPSVVPGTIISATATDANGNTSEFAANVVAVALGN
jgi:hypothetical protein